MKEMARKAAVKLTKDLIGTVNADGTITAKVAKGKTVTTSTGKTVAGGKFAGTVASPTKAKTAKAKAKKVVDEIDDWDEFDDDAFDPEDVDAIIDDEPATTAHLYITKDGIVGNVLEDGLQIIDTSNISEEDLDELADAPADEREDLADALRQGRGYTATRHYFNDSGEYGPVSNLRVIDGAELTKSEMSSLLDSADPYSESKNYDNSGYNIVSVIRQMKTQPHSGSQDDLLDDEMVSEGTSYR